MFPCATKRCEYRIIVCFFEQVLSVNRGINRREKKPPTGSWSHPPCAPVLQGLGGKQEWMDTAASGAEWIRKSCWPTCTLLSLHRGREKKRDCEGRDAEQLPYLPQLLLGGGTVPTRLANQLTRKRTIFHTRERRRNHNFAFRPVRPPLSFSLSLSLSVSHAGQRHWTLWARLTLV